MKASKWNRPSYPQSEGNLALASESVESLRRTRPPHLAVPGTVRAIDEEDLTSDASAMGVLVGAGLSVILWVFLALVMMWSQ